MLAAFESLTASGIRVSTVKKNHHPKYKPCICCTWAAGRLVLVARLKAVEPEWRHAYWDLHDASFMSKVPTQLLVPAAKSRLKCASHKDSLRTAFDTANETWAARASSRALRNDRIV